MSAAFLDILILIGIFSLITLGLDFIVGYTKIFSVNQGLIFAVGAFSYVFTSQILGIREVFLAWLVAVVASCALSAVIGFASLRVKGDAFVVVSFGAQIIGMQVLYNATPLSGGQSGIFGLPGLTIFGWMPRTQVDYLLLIAAVTVIAYVLTAFIVRSPWGRLLRATGEDDVAVAAGGFDPRKLKVVAFMLGGAYAAIAGPLYVSYIGTAQVGDFSLAISISLLAMVILGGAGRLLGGLAGAVIYVLVPYLLDFADLPSATAAFVKQGIFGVALLAVVLFLPSGLTGGVAEWIDRLRHRDGRSKEVRS
jgi:branched-chain amino acid transport system permease protein